MTTPVFNIKYIILIAFFSFCSGIFFYCIKRDFIIFQIPGFTATHLSQGQQKIFSTKRINLCFYRYKTLHQETVNFVWSSDQTDNCLNIINKWLQCMLEEKVITKTVVLQAVMFSPAGHELYISFNCNPLEKEKSIHEKWLFIEGLLATVRENNITIQAVHFLVQHQPLNDPHLDFSKPWPLHGFLVK